MNTQGIIGVLIAIVVVGGGVWYATTHPMQEMEGMGTETEQTGTTNSSSGSGTIGTLLGLTGSVKCDVSTSVGDTQSSGTVYVANNQMRGDFSSTIAGKAIVSHMVRANGFIYSWSDMMPQGVKIAESTVAASSTTQGSTQGFSTNTQVQYSCVPWAADVSQFAPPSTVTFMEFSGKAGMPTAMPQ